MQRLVIQLITCQITDIIQVEGMDRNRAISNTNSAKRLLGNNSLASSGHKAIVQRPQNQAQSETGFYDALRVYAERLKEERQTSLSYMKRCNQASQMLRMKDIQIAKLTKQNQQLSGKLSVYESVLTRSRAKTSRLRMSNVVHKDNMMESIIEYGTPQQLLSNVHRKNQTQLTFRPLVEQARQVRQKVQLFQQFFILKLGEDGQPAYQYKHTEDQNKIQEIIKLYVQHPEFVIKPYQGNPVKTSTKKIVFLADSMYTTYKKSAWPHVPLLNEVNPSNYYFGFCLLQKELMSINGQYYWVPVVYGFVTFFPFPDHFMKILDLISKDAPHYKDQKVLTQSLNALNSVLNSISKNDTTLALPAQLKYSLFNRSHTLSLPSLEHINEILLGYSKQLFKNYALELIVDVLMLLLLEIPIAILSEDVQSLGQFMIYFVSLIKPLKYPFPIVFHLPDSMESLLSSPFPTFVGSTNISMIEKHMSDRAVFDLDKKIAKSWPVLEHLDTARKYLMSAINKNGNQIINISSLVLQILDGKRVSEMQNYWKDFSKTQIYQLYAGGQ